MQDVPITPGSLTSHLPFPSLVNPVRNSSGALTPALPTGRQAELF